MSLALPSRTPRRLALVALLALVLVATFGSAAPAGAQEGDADEARCAFTKREAIEANGGPLGASIWGRLCQVQDGKATFPEGVEITVSQDGEEVASATTGDDGVFVVEIPGNGTYQVALDTETLPKGYALTDEDRATLSGVTVNLGDQQVAFRLGEDSRGSRDLQDYLTTAAKGLRLGLIIAVAAVGLSLVYGVTGLINFAHAELVTFGAIVAFVLNDAGIPFWLCIPLAVLAGCGAGWTNNRLLWQPLRKRNMAMVSQMVVSIGLSIALRNIFLIVFGPNSKRYSAASGQREKDFGLVRLTPNDLIIMGICVVVLIGITLMLRKTRLGTAIRATADNPDLAASSGIGVNKIIAIVWIICGGMAALGGILYGLSVTVTSDMGFILLLSMFAAVVLGGLGNAYGALFGAIILGVMQETSGLFVDTAYKFVVALAVLIVVLLVRPQGLLGTKERFG
jgi:branched-chain amino acid transport system permease protein